MPALHRLTRTLTLASLQSIPPHDLGSSTALLTAVAQWKVEARHTLAASLLGRAHCPAEAVATLHVHVMRFIQAVGVHSTAHHVDAVWCMRSASTSSSDPLPLRPAAVAALSARLAALRHRALLPWRRLLAPCVRRRARARVERARHPDQRRRRRLRAMHLALQQLERARRVVRLLGAGGASAQGRVLRQLVRLQHGRRRLRLGRHGPARRRRPLRGARRRHVLALQVRRVGVRHGRQRVLLELAPQLLAGGRLRHAQLLRRLRRGPLARRALRQQPVHVLPVALPELQRVQVHEHGRRLLAR